MSECKGHLFILTHTDLDGIGAAAVLLRVSGRKLGVDASVAFVEPYELHETLRSLSEHVTPGDCIAVSDLGVNPEYWSETLEHLGEIARKRARIEWYDHHVWENSEIEAVRKLGALVYIDRTTCATGVVARYAPLVWGREADEHSSRLVDVVCSADLWRWNNPYSPKLFRAVGSREESYKWKLRVLEKLASGVLWDEELASRLEEYVSAELSNVDKALSTLSIRDVDGVRIAVVLKDEGPPANGVIASILMARHSADIACIARPNGGLSLRSRTVNVRELSKRLGGGGHPRAAGARIRIPAVVRLLSRLSPRILTFYIAWRLAKEIRAKPLPRLSEERESGRDMAPY